MGGGTLTYLQKSGYIVYPLLSAVNKPTHTTSSFQLILLFYKVTCTGGGGYSF